MLSKPALTLLFSGVLWAAACGDDSSNGDPAAGGAGQGGSVAGGKAGSGGKATTGGASSAGASSGGSATGGATTGGAAAGGSGGSALGGSAGSSAGATGGVSAGAGGETEGGSAGSGEGGEGGFAGVPQEPGEEALLDQPNGEEYACRVEQPLRLLDLAWSQGVLLPGAVPSLVYSAENPGGVASASLDFDGTLGTPRAVRELDGGWPSGLTAARRAETTTIVWAEAGTDLTQLMLAQLDAGGDIVTDAHVVSAAPMAQNRPTIVETTDGYALLWSELNQDQSALKFARLDAAGALVGTPKTLRQGNSVSAGTMIRVEESFAITYSEYTDKYRIFYLALDAEGTPLRSGVPLGSNLMMDADLIQRGDRVLAAWSVLQGGYDTENMAINVRVGYFDRRGNPVGATYDLQKPVVHEQALEPRWVELGDDLGLVWAKGGIIYICAGCIPDDHLEFVVLDGQTLAKVSNVVSVTNSESVGGLRRPQMAASGDDLLIVPSVTYHVSAEASSVTLSCVH